MYTFLNISFVLSTSLPFIAINLLTVSDIPSSNEANPTFFPCVLMRSNIISLITVLFPDPVPDVKRVISPCLIPFSLSFKPGRQSGYGIEITFLYSSYFSHISPLVKIPAGLYSFEFHIAFSIALYPCLIISSHGSFSCSLPIFTLPTPIILAACSIAFSPASSLSNSNTTSSNDLTQSLCFNSVLQPVALGNDTTG